MSEMPDWLRAYVLMGQTGDVPPDYKAVLVAEDGELYAVLQGIYGEELRTVKLDGEGRISAFVIDSTDAWGRMLSVGNAELAVRLGSAIAYDRRGQVAHFQDFERGFGAWTGSTAGTAAAVALDPTTSLSGGYSCKLTGGSDGAGMASVRLDCGIVPVGKMGLEFAFSLGTIFDTLETQFSFYDGSNHYSARVRYFYTTGVIMVLDETSGWTTVGTVAHAGIDSMHYNTLKYVFDQTTQKYERLLFNGEEFDLSAVSYYDYGASALSQIKVSVACYSRGGQNDYVNVDDIIVTLAEPAN